jgi:hypothetical protein
MASGWGSVYVTHRIGVYIQFSTRTPLHGVNNSIIKIPSYNFRMKKNKSEKTIT